MSTKLHTKVKRTLEFQHLIAKRALSTREHFLMQLILRVAEEDLGKERLNHSETMGQLAVAEQQTKFALILASAGRIVGNSVNFLCTPFSQMPDLYFRTNDTRKLHKPVTSPEVPNNPNIEILGISDPEPTDKSRLHMFISGLPHWLQACFLFFKDRMAHLSPMTTTILFIVAITGAIYFGKYEKANIENSYALALNDIKKYKADANELPKVKKELQQKKTELSTLEITRNGLNDQITNLRQDLDSEKKEHQQTVKRHNQKLDEIRNSHSAELKTLRGDLQEETLKKITKLESENQKISKELDAANQQVATHFKDLQEAKRDLGIAEKELSLKEEKYSGLKSDHESQAKRIHELEDYENKFARLSGFTRDVLSLVKENLIDANTKYITNQRKNFKDKYKLLYSQSEDLFRTIGLRRKF